MPNHSATRFQHGELVLSLRNVSKRFGAVSALTDIELDVHAGEVVALVGDNGAGKSTLVKVLAGVHQPTTGTITFGGQPVTLPNPGVALDLGIATVFQDLALCENLDVVANIYLGRELAPLRLDEVAMEVRAAADRGYRPLAVAGPAANHARRTDGGLGRSPNRGSPESD